MDEAALEAEIGRLIAEHAWGRAADRAVRGFGPGVFGYLVTLLGDRARAQDAFSQVCEALWRGLPEFRGDSRVKTWLYGIAWNVASHARRDAGRRRARPLATDEEERLAAAQRTVTATWRKTAAKDRLAEVRARLTPEEQTLLILRIDRALAFGEVARVLAVDEAAVRKRFERLKKKLQSLVADGADHAG